MSPDWIGRLCDLSQDVERPVVDHFGGDVGTLDVLSVELSGALASEFCDLEAAEGALRKFVRTGDDQPVGYTWGIETRL